MKIYLSKEYTIINKRRKLILHTKKQKSSISKILIRVFGGDFSLSFNHEIKVIQKF